MYSSSSQSRYQGYPYVNPTVTDIPTLDPAIAGRWANLPRRQISGEPSRPAHAHKRDTHTSGLEMRDVSSSAARALPIPPEPNENPVVYIDLPEEGGNDVTVHRQERRPQNNQAQPSTSSARPVKPEPNDTPVVYIDLPDESGSNVSQSNQRREEPQFVQETIFYNPFDNKTIAVAGDSRIEPNTPKNLDSDEESVGSRRRIPRTVAVDLTGSSAGTPPTTPVQSNLPDLYINLPESNLPASLPTSAFPEPPPAYTEYDVSTPTQTPTVDQPRLDQPRQDQPRQDQPRQPPPTQVILPGPIGVTFNTDRQYIRCHHCGVQVHTLVVKEVGMMTHLSALLCLIIGMIPCVVLIYYMDCLKNKNHFCPNCNKVIGYELPMKTKKIVCV